MTVTVDAGGIVVEVTGPDHLVGVVRERLGSAEAVGTPAVRLVIASGSPCPPDRAADATSTDAELWWDDDLLVLSWNGVVARRSDSTVTITVPADRLEEPATFDAVDRLTQYGLAATVAAPDRALLHAAAIGRDGGAVVVVGSSGSGKSTLAAAAWRHGWSLLGDDLVVLRRRGDRLSVRGVRRPPLVPDEVVAAEAGELVPEGRARRRLPPEVLSDAELVVSGVVVVDHDPGPGRIDVVPAADRVPALLHGLAVPPVAPVLTAHLPMLAALGASPVQRLAHARDAGRRATRAAELLDEIDRLVAG